MLKGILWHQGESDADDTLVVKYRDNLCTLMQQFRTIFNNPKLPIVIGQLGYNESRQKREGNQKVSQILRDYTLNTEYAGYVSSDGLTFNEDDIHFDRKSQLEFGRRYAEVYLKVIKQQ